METSNTTALQPTASGKSKQRTRPVRQSIGNLVERAWSPLESLAMSAVSMLSFYPRVSMDETDDHVEVAVFVPGVEANELKVAIEGTALMVNGSKGKGREKRGTNGDHRTEWHRLEWHRTPFERTIRVRSSIAAEKATATLKNGVLHIRLPKVVKGSNGNGRRVPIAIRAA
jgi:HSP20 family protein